MQTIRLSTYLTRLQQIPGMDSPVVRWGIVCIAIFFLWFMLLAPWEKALQHEQEMLNAQRMEAVRLQLLQSRMGVWQDADKQFSQALAQASQGLLKSTSETAAQSELQRLLQLMLRQYHLKVETQLFMPAATESGVGNKVSIQLRMVGQMSDGYRFLDALAKSDHLFIIEKLHLGRRASGEMGIVIQVAGFMAASEEIS